MLTQSGILDLTVHALLLMLKVSMPPILVAAIVGLLVSFFQAVTQLQEQTLSFSIKLACVMFVILLTATWLGGEVLSFTEHLFKTFWHYTI